MHRLLLSVALLLAACGGAAPTDAPPATANPDPLGICVDAYAGCLAGMALIPPGSLVAVCDYSNGTGDIVLIDNEADAESMCSGDGAFSPSRVLRVVQLPDDPNATLGPDPTDPPWPAAFEENFCLAVAENAIFTEDLQALRDAAAAGDLDALSLHAYSLSADVGVIEVALQRAPKWAPATALVKTWRKALAALGPAFDKIDAAASAGNLKRLKAGLQDLAKASKLLPTSDLRAFVATTRFTCQR